jgi:hypothetical protein
MHKESKRGKPIGEDKMTKFVLTPNLSLGEFIIGDNIEKYTNISHVVNNIDAGTYSYNSYVFYNNAIKIWLTEDNKIETILCNKRCYWQDKNLIGMLYDDFLILSGQCPDTESEGYVLTNSDKKQKQKVYEFITLGLQIWVYQKKIRAIIISRYDSIKNYTLIPNISLGKFIIDDDVRKYLNLNHFVSHFKGETFSYDSYDFYNETVTIWVTENNKIETIKCNFKCYWKGENLIGMLFDQFLKLSGKKPNQESVEYVPIDCNKGQNQAVYEFEELGLQVWVWRKKIKTILISKYQNQ